MNIVCTKKPLDVLHSAAASAVCVLLFRMKEQVKTLLYLHSLTLTAAYACNAPGKHGDRWKQRAQILGRVVNPATSALKKTPKKSNDTFTY